ncbi:UDP-N-acetylmuramoyl-L-alanine--D-glutamate ligase [Gangjinia marincola]|uniref:UDP-N-acetylmuramoylalanine--D-glutamate ligase n=1 Tax=Gangjinia marincola TaxID=578463 RepID=A0ABP3XXW4_9FLAO
MKRLVILGGGESGVGTAVLGKKQGYDVFVSDAGEISAVKKEILTQHEIEFEEAKHSNEQIFSADIVMKSPGIPDSVQLVKELKAKNIPVISEIEFASRYTNATIIGITGSNGKTTTTALTHYILKNEVNAVMAGNIGDSFAMSVAIESPDYYVLELSSFQLDGIKAFKPHIAVITNITPDHLDRYNNNFEEYIAAKFRITMNQDENDFLIYDGDDPVITDWISSHTIKAKQLPFSLTKTIEEGAYVTNNTININLKNKSFVMPTINLGLQGNHNVKNAMAASTVAKLLDIRKQTIRESMEHFQGVEHRLETVLKINHVQYINDSKATNVNATFYALDSMLSDTVWIVGGVDKGNDYDELLPLVREKVKAIVCLGVDNTKLMNAFSPCVDLMIETQSMSEAVKIAYKIAERGDNVLLSPACASFDLYENYEDRGNQFKQAVRSL